MLADDGAGLAETPNSLQVTSKLAKEHGEAREHEGRSLEDIQWLRRPERN